MKRVLSITLLFILVPSFFMFIIYKEEDEIISEVITKHITKKNKNGIFIKVKQTSKNKIIKVDLEEYVKGVIAGEMPVSFNIEALKAQAVAARTYGVKRINEKNTYDVVDTVMNQVYLDDDTLKIRWKTYYSIYKEKIHQRQAVGGRCGYLPLFPGSVKRAKRIPALASGILSVPPPAESPEEKAGPLLRRSLWLFAG